uniref:Secreted protein n=1 Tax=Heterorhabditis bacteriophora TaxID=37862 RepID=A0A1I7WIT0_HETBA
MILYYWEYLLFISLNIVNRAPHHGPVITVEDTGSQLRINHVKSSITDSLIESQKGSVDKSAVVFCESNGSTGSHPTTGHFKRNNSRYVFSFLIYTSFLNLDLVDCGADDWRVVATTEKVLQFCTEFILCAICPLPGSGSMNWSFIETSRNMHSGQGRSFHIKEDIWTGRPGCTFNYVLKCIVVHWYV